jgi:tetratricopeptide (TPR) repeat protein
LPYVLTGAAAVCIFLAGVDKALGVFQQPLLFATGAYASLFALLVWALTQGLHLGRPTPRKVSVFGAILLLNLLTAGYVFAWKKLSSNSTPLVVEQVLDRGDTLYDEGFSDDAYAQYKEALQRSPRSFPALMRMGMVTYHMSDFERARRYFERALEVAPAELRWRALNDLGQTHWKLGDPEEAIALYQQAEKASMPESERIEWHYRLAWAYFDIQNYDAAIEHYRVVAEAGQKYAAAAYYNIACALAKKLVLAADPKTKSDYALEAVGSLRAAMSVTYEKTDRDALRGGLIGPPEERDPDLAPLVVYPEYRAFVRALPKR